MSPVFCVCVYVHVFMNNSFTSVVVPVKHSCTGRRPSQVIAALTGHSRHSPATPQMCVFSAPERENMAGKLQRWQGQNTEGKSPACCCTIPQNKLELKSQEKARKPNRIHKFNTVHVIPIKCIVVKLNMKAIYENKCCLCVPVL